MSTIQLATILDEYEIECELSNSTTVAEQTSMYRLRKGVGLGHF